MDSVVEVEALFEVEAPLGLFVEFFLGGHAEGELAVLERVGEFFLGLVEVLAPDLVLGF